MFGHLTTYLRERQFRSIGFVFAMHAVLFSLWVTRLPEVKTALGLTEGTLGITLFFLPLGAFLAMLMANWFIQRWGSGPVTMVSLLVYLPSMVLPLMAQHVVWLGAALFLVGMLGGVLDIAMNAVVAMLEKRHQTVIMATTHGFFSLGGMIGAVLGSVMIGLGVPGAWAMAATVGLFLLGAFWLNPIIYPLTDPQEESSGSHFVLPGRAVLGLSIIAFCTMMGEGAVADWSAVYLKEEVLAGASLIGLGYAGFSLTMTMGRFMGDRLIHRFGSNTIVLAGSLISATGLGMVLFAEPISTIFGFTLVGLGYSSMIPVVFSEAARSDPASPARGITAVATLGYTGFLVGPVLIGLISEDGGLRVGMLFLLGTVILTMAIATRRRSRLATR